MTAAAYLVLLERWIAAWVQDRRGPNRVGIPLTKIKMFGLGQPLADGLKFIFKEEYTPAHVDKALYILAPIVDPGGGAGHLCRDSVRQRAAAVDLPGMRRQPIELVVAPGVDVGMIYVFALSQHRRLWRDPRRLGQQQQIQLPGRAAIERPVDRLRDSAGPGHSGRRAGQPARCGWRRSSTEQAASGVWNAFAQPLGLVVFLVASFAEAARLPFDLPEASRN